MIDAPCARAASTANPWNVTIRTSVPDRLAMPRVSSSSISTRSPAVNSGALPGLVPMPMTSSSMIRHARAITSVWPCVTGSKEPE